MFLVEAANLGQFHHEPWKHESSERLGVARLQVSLQQQAVALLLGADVVAVGEVVSVGGEEREDQKKDERCLVGAQLDRQRPDELHLFVEHPRPVLGKSQLLQLHRLSLLVVDRVQEVLLVRVEGDDRAQNQQFDAAGLEQLDLVGLWQRAERADLFRHGDDPAHAELGDVDEVGEAGGSTVQLHGGVLRLQRRPVRLEQLVDRSRVVVTESDRLRAHFTVHRDVNAGHRRRRLLLELLLLSLLLLFHVRRTTQAPAKCQQTSDI